MGKRFARHLPCMHQAKYQDFLLLSILFTLLIVISTLKRTFSWYEKLSLRILCNSCLELRSYRWDFYSESILWNPSSLQSLLPSSLWLAVVSDTSLQSEAAPIMIPCPHFDLTKFFLQLSSPKEASATHKDTCFVVKMLLGSVYCLCSQKLMIRTHWNRKFATWKH